MAAFRNGLAVPLVVFLALAQAAVWVVLWSRHALGFASPARGVMEISASLLLLLVELHLWNQIAPRRPALHRLFNGALVVVHVALAAATLTLGQPPEYGILVDNLELLAYPSSLIVLAEAMQLRVALGALAGVILVAGLAIRGDVLRRAWPRRSPGRLALLAVAYGSLLGAVWWGPVRTHDVGSRFLRSVVDYYVLPGLGDVGSSTVAGALRAFEPTYADARRPNVFVVFLESFNGLWVGRRTPAGEEVTPVLNRLAAQGLWVEHFYGNSIRSTAGYATTLCSILPSLQGAIVVHYPDLRLRCLPQTLAEAGYETYFFNNASSMQRQRVGPFLRDNGVRHALALDDGLADPRRDRDLLWGFDGTLQDDVLFDRVFDHLDEDRRRGLFDAAAGRPAFVGISTGSNHMWFDWVPDRERRLYRRPRNRTERFAMSLNVADRYLGSLVDNLARRPWARDSLVILLGDHGFPSGEHGNFSNTVGAWEENFRTPLLLLSPGWLPPRRIDDRAYSQLDVMPTILDLLGIPSRGPMYGESIVAPEASAPRPELLLQPHDGRRLVALRYPFKLVRRLDTGQEALFDLATDPSERRNLLSGPLEHDLESVARELRASLPVFLQNQLLLRTDGFVSAR